MTNSSSTLEPPQQEPSAPVDAAEGPRLFHSPELADLVERAHFDPQSPPAPEKPVTFLPGPAPSQTGAF